MKLRTILMLISTLISGSMGGAFVLTKWAVIHTEKVGWFVLLPIFVMNFICFMSEVSEKEKEQHND